MNYELTILAAILCIIAVWVVLSFVVAISIEKSNSERKAFWWIFFLGVFFGPIIYLLLEIRDK